MKKLFAVAFMAVVAFSASAQGIIQGTSDIKKFRFGPVVGLNVASVTADFTSSKVGFNVGAIAEYNFNDNIFLTGALKYSMKGYRSSFITDSGDRDNANPGYLEIPIHAGYRYNFSKFSLFLDFGPYIAIGVSGKCKYYNDRGDVTKINYFGDATDPNDTSFGAKRFDAGLGVGIGGEYKNFQLRLAWDFGLARVNGIEVPSVKNTKNRNFSVNVSYMF